MGDTVSTSRKIEVILDMIRTSQRTPAMALKTVEGTLGVILLEVQELERVHAEAPQDASPMDAVRKRQEELEKQMRDGVARFRTDMAGWLRSAAQSLDESK